MDQKQKTQGSLTKLLNFASDCKGKFILSILLAIVGVLCGMAPYFSVAKITAAFFNGTQTFSFIMKWSFIAIGGQLLKMLLTTLSSMKSHEAAFSIMKNIRSSLLQKMERVPMGVMIDTPSGTLKTLVVDVVDKIEKPLAHILPEMTSNILVPVFMLIVLFMLDWRMALASLAAIPVGFLVFMGQMIGYREKSARYAKANDDMNNAIVEYVTGIEVIKAFNQSASSYGKYTNAVKYFRDSTLDWWRGCWFFSSTGNSIISSTLLVALPVGAYLFLHGELDFSIFITCVVLSLGIAGPIMAAAQYVENFALVSQSLTQITEFLELPELNRPTKKVSLQNAQFCLKNVRFGYGDTEVLHGIDLETVPCGVTAIVGPSGSGKSTIAKLMAGFWDVTGGTMTYGGALLNKIPIEQLMKEVSYVAQDNFLFDKTIMENIRMGCPEASDAEVIQAAKEAGCHEFIEKLEHGYQTKVGDAGGKLSGGERQRITIARAMMKKAEVVILDEATAYADPENEAVVQAAINKLVAGKTLIVIAHRLSTIKNADKIVVVDDGRIIAQGKQQELLDSCSLYKRMWDDHIAATTEA